MYTYFWRSSPYPFLTTFDAPDATNTCTRRARSNTPLQALTMANDRAFFELAQGLAARVLRESGDEDQSRIERAVRLCLVREPTAAESARLENMSPANGPCSRPARIPKPWRRRTGRPRFPRPKARPGRRYRAWF